MSHKPKHTHKRRRRKVGSKVRRARAKVRHNV